MKSLPQPQYILWPALLGIILMILFWSNQNSFLGSTAQSNATSTLAILTEEIPTLPPHRHDIEIAVDSTGHGVNIVSSPITVPEDTWITALEPTVQNAPNTTIHHMALLNLDTHDFVCPTLPENLITVGQDTGSFIPMTKTYGIFVKKNTRLQVHAILHNPEIPLGTGETYHNVSAGFIMHTSSNANNELKPVSYYLFGVGDPPYCGEDGDYTNQFTVPPRSSHYVKKSTLEEKPNQTYIVFPRNGKIIGMGSHMHGWQGGTTLSVFLNWSLIQSFKSTKISDIPEVWSSPSGYMSLDVSAGDRLTLSSEYTNTGNEPIEGAMGMLGVYFAEN